MIRSALAPTAVVALMAFGCVWATSASLAETATPADQAAAPEDAADGEAHPALTDEELDAIMSRGRGVYASTCSSCHAADGSGDIGPSLRGNSLLGDTMEVADTIINGFSYMPPLGGSLDDAQVAAVLTYIRNSWGNAYPPVLPEDVAPAR